jgi:hypothetical protein
MKDSIDMKNLDSGLVLISCVPSELRAFAQSDLSASCNPGMLNMHPFTSLRGYVVNMQITLF